jgi:hypothetical protein
MCTPSISSSSSAAMILTSPLVCSIALARPLAANGNEPFLYLRLGRLDGEYASQHGVPPLPRSDER